MRIILTFFLSFSAFFFLGELIRRVFKTPSYGVPGLLLMLGGFLAGFLGQALFYPPLNIYLAALLLGAGAGLTIHHLLTMRYIIHGELEWKLARRYQTKLERFLEILPGATTWIALTSPLWLSFTLPFAVAYLIILADVYWLISAIRQAVLMILAYRKMRWAEKQPWLSRLEKDFPDEWKKYYHLLLLPVYKESLQVLGPSFDAVVNSNYPKDKIFLAVGFEERVNPRKLHKDTIRYLKKLDKKIGGVLITFHPYGLEGEVPGPGTNRNWIVKNAQAEFSKRGIAIENVIVTTLDADFVIHPNFLPGMMHKYLETPAQERLKRSFTGAFLYTNNYWQTSAPMRMIALGTAFWQMSEMYGSDKYMNFSSLSINLASLMDIGGWFPDKVNDDSGFYWRAYYHFSGDYKVIAHFLPIYGDAVLDVNLIKTFQNQYLQLKRWAYGVEHIPFVVTQYFKHTEIDFWNRTDHVLFAMWGYLRWGFLAVFVTFAGLVIPLINPYYKESAVAVNLPIVSSWILTVAFLGLLVTIVIHEKTVPPRPKSWSPLQRVWSYLQFLLIPLVLVSISTIPAIDAQTTLMFGKHLEFRTTNKARLPTA